jgi:hypothetical protein
MCVDILGLVILSVSMLSVVRLSVFMVSVEAPFSNLTTKHLFPLYF